MGLKVHCKTNGISAVWLFVGDVYLLQEGDCSSQPEFSVFLTACFTLMAEFNQVCWLNCHFARAAISQLGRKRGTAEGDGDSWPHVSPVVGLTVSVSAVQTLLHDKHEPDKFTFTISHSAPASSLQELQGHRAGWKGSAAELGMQKLPGLRLFGPYCSHHHQVPP